VKVPVKNLLGKRGEGFRIALSILHIGRIKLGANVIGAGKRTITQTVNYANERKQFGKTIANFGAIKYKIAEQVIRIFAAESALYRVSKYIDDTIALMLSQGIENGKADVEGVAKYAVECALMKVYGSETLDYIVDEAVQVYGGMGFSAETPIERSYRDSRINRIFEGTNEINRMLVIDTALKSAMKGEIALFEKAKSVFESIDDIPDVQFSNETQFFDTLNTLVLNLKKAVLLIIGVGFEKYKKQLLSKQQVMMNLSDMMMQSYIAESTLLRVQKLNNKNGAQQIYRDIADTFIYDAASRIQKSGLDAINSLIEGDLRIKITEGLMKLTQAKPVDVSETRTRIADVIIEENRYKL
ncbi:MAG: acyl-CoA dehydrogenase family protein, partial [Bacteroidales bacterium]|nr:acyl-CoA dehydrogenase family protein [Bacteroidales bacterium]